MGVEQEIKVKISALVSGLKEVQKLQTELRGLERTAGKKLSINTSGLDSGGAKFLNILRQLSPAADSSIGKVESLAKAAGFSLSGMAGSAGLALAGITALAGGSVSLVALLFQLTKEVADVGAEVNDFSIKTGLSAETVSGLRLQLKQSGTDLQTFSNGFFELEKRLVDAAEGGKEAAAAFKKVGIDAPKKALTDMEGTLRQVVKGLAAIPDEAKRNKAGADLMSKSYKELAVFIKDTGGNIDAVIEKARQMGGVMSSETASALDKFGDDLDTLGYQLESVKIEIGTQLLPVFSKFANEFSSWLSSNPGEVKAWGGVVVSIVEEVVGSIAELADWVKQITEALNWLAGSAPTPPTDGFGPGETARGGKPNSIYNGYDPTTKSFRASGDTPTKPKHRTGGGGGNNTARDAQRRELESVRLFNQEQEAMTRTNREILERERELNLKSLAEYVQQAHDDNVLHYRGEIEALTREQEIASKYIKNKEDLALKRREIDLRTQNAEDAYNKERQRINDFKLKSEQDSQLALEKQLVALRDEQRKTEEARIKEQAENGIISREEEVDRLFEIEKQGILDREQLIEIELAQANVLPDRWTEATNERIKLEEQLTAATEENIRRREAARNAEGATRPRRVFGEPDEATRPRRVFEKRPGIFDQIEDFARDSGIDTVVNGLTDIATGARSAADAFREMALSIIAEIEAMVIKFLILAAVKAIAGIASGGGGGDLVSHGGLSGHGGSIPHLAEGAEIAAQPGGKLALIAEGGHDEFVMSTDPQYKQRTMGLMETLMGRLGVTPADFTPGYLAARIASSIVPANSRYAMGGLAEAVGGIQPGGRGVGDTYNIHPKVTIVTPNPRGFELGRAAIERDIGRTVKNSLKRRG